MGMKSNLLTGLWSRQIKRRVQGQATFETETVFETDMDEETKQWLQEQLSSGRYVEFVHKEVHTDSEGKPVKDKNGEISITHKIIRARFIETPKMIEFIEVKVDEKTMEKLPKVRKGDYLQVWENDQRKSNDSPTHQLRVRTQEN